MVCFGDLRRSTSAAHGPCETDEVRVSPGLHLYGHDVIRPYVALWRWLMSLSCFPSTVRMQTRHLRHTSSGKTTMCLYIKYHSLSVC